MKKISKQIQSLYEYSQALDYMPPRGDGAKDAVAMEIHDEVKGVFNSMIKQLKGKHPEKIVETSCLLLELVERILLDKIGDGYTPEEMEERGDI